MDLIVCEKPSAARDFASALNAKWDDKEKIYRSSSANIAVLRGHLLRLKGLKETNSTFQSTWNPSILVHLPQFPNLFDKPMYDYAKSDSALIQALKQQFLNKNYHRIINATDPGREGELLFWELYDYFNASTPVARFWVSQALSKSVVLDGLKNLKNEVFFGPRRAAAYTRQHTDWYVGMNLTVAYTAACNTFFSVGTVQTPTLALVVRRDELIENWKQTSYHEVSLEFDGFSAKYKPDTPFTEERPYSLDTESANQLIQTLKSAHTGTVQSLDTQDIKVLSPMLFSLTTLQIKANEKFGLSGDATLKIAQKMYEEYKCLSYPRTDSEVIGETMQDQVSKISTELSKYYQIPSEIPRFTKRNMDDSKLTDHHALIPLKPVPDAASDIEKKVYMLVMQRFFEAFSLTGIDRKAKVTILVEDYPFEATGRISKDPGWRSLFSSEVDEEDTTDDLTLPALFQLGNKQIISVIGGPNNETKSVDPPKRYTEAILYKSMRNIANSIEDKALRNAMKDVDGRLGTPATQAAMIELLIKRGYIQRKSKQLISTAEGRALIHTVSPELTDVVQRARMEQLLNDFENVDASGEYMRSVRTLIENNVRYCHELNPKDTLPTIDVQCPSCQKALMAKRFQYQCPNCDFSLPKSWGNYTLSIHDIKRLATGQMTEIHTFQSKDKAKSFPAQLQLNDKKIEYHFPSKEDLSYGSCPVCTEGGVMYPKGDKVLACTKCSYVLFRTIAGKKLTDAQLKKLLMKKSTAEIKGFTKKDKTTFSAALVLTSDGKVQFTKP